MRREVFRKQKVIVLRGEEGSEKKKYFGCLFALWWRKEKRARRTPRREPGFERSERARAREQTALRKETAEFCVHQRPHSFASPFFFLDSPMLSRKTTE